MDSVHYFGRLTALTLLGSLALNSTPILASQSTSVTVAGRTAIVYLPDSLPPSGSRAMVVVLHGGLGNAERIASRRSESAINLDAVADQAGFVVAYLNGTAVARLLSDERRGWNAGACCGMPAEKKVDDVAYVQAAVEDITQRYGVDRKRVFAVGHSNGAMMTQRVMCETSLFAAGVPISGGLESGAQSCPAAQGKRLMAIHGEEDQNVPLKGGRGTKGISRTDFASQAATAQIWRDSGAEYDLQVIRGADHSTEVIDAQIVKAESKTLAQKIARFFGLLAPN
jgi:poly(3-hydroxybutyrate) depolymerase